MPSAKRSAFIPEVRTRGKRARHVASKASDLEPGLRRRGRPMKRAAELATTRRKEQSERHRVKRVQTPQTATKDPATRRLSPLERLPVELIEQIFFWSLEISLVRACPYFAEALSKESTYSSLILLAFFDDDGGFVEAKYFEPAQYYCLSLNQKIRLQTDILDCKWCTLERIQKCMPVLSRLKMVQAWYRENENEASAERSHSTQLFAPNPLLQGVAVLPDVEDEAALERHYLAKTYIDPAVTGLSFATSNEYLPRIRTWTFSQDEQRQFHKTLDGSASTLGVRRIPDRLLTGSPWTREKIDYLAFLRQGHRFICSDLVLSISPEAMFRGMESAIRESHPEALRMLVELHHAAFRLDRFTIDGFRPPHQMFAVPFSHPIPPHLFHVAARQSRASDDKNPGLMSLLIREGIDSIPRDDPILTKWVIRSSADGCAVARWLRKHMEGTEDYGLGGRDSPLFINGTITWRRNEIEGGYPFPQSTFTEELRYLTDGALAFIPELR